MKFTFVENEEHQTTTTEVAVAAVAVMMTTTTMRWSQSSCSHECCVRFVKSPSSDPHSNRKLLPTKHSTSPIHTHTQSRHSRDRRVNNETEHNTKQEIPDWNMTFSNVVRHTVIVICRFPIDFITLYCNFSTLQFPCACCSISHARSFCRYLHWFSRINNCFVFIRR